MNKIPETQLEETQLKRLAARRQLESDAKCFLGLQMGLSTLSVLAAIFVAVSSQLNPGLSSALDVWVSLLGVSVTLLNILCFAPWQQTLTEKAVKIHELFDCSVLELSQRELLIGSRLALVETIEKSSAKYERKNGNYCSLKNWYPKRSGELPIHLGRLICQRTNCWWGAELRQLYMRILIGALVFLLICAFALGLIGDCTLEKFILVVATPLMPAFVLVIQQRKAHVKSLALLDKLRTHAEGLWEKSLVCQRPKELTDASRELQDAIYEHRRTGPPIFDWFYERHRADMEDLTIDAVEEMVEKALETMKS